MSGLQPRGADWVVDGRPRGLCCRYGINDDSDDSDDDPASTSQISEQHPVSA